MRISLTMTNLPIDFCNFYVKVFYEKFSCETFLCEIFKSITLFDFFFVSPSLPLGVR